jgi:thiol-disulfide isomerase/thioredoxin
MSLTIPAVTVAVLSCVNIVLLLGIARRLNRLTSRGADLPAPSLPEFSLPEAGTVVGNFIASTTAGDRISTKDLRERTLVGFFTLGCPPCERFTPAFRSYASTFAGAQDQVLAVIVGGNGDPTTLTQELGDIARVIVEPSGGPVSTAFGIDAFPLACLLKGNVITAADVDLESWQPPLHATAAR